MGLGGGGNSPTGRGGSGFGNASDRTSNGRGGTSSSGDARGGGGMGSMNGNWNTGMRSRQAAPGLAALTPAPIPRMKPASIAPMVQQVMPQNYGFVNPYAATAPSYTTQAFPATPEFRKGIFSAGPTYNLAGSTKAPAAERPGFTAGPDPYAGRTARPSPGFASGPDPYAGRTASPQSGNVPGNPVQPQNVGFKTPSNYDIAKTRYAQMQKASQQAALAESPGQSEAVEDLRGPNPSVAEGQLPGFNPSGIRTKNDANLSYLGSRGTGLDTTGMNPEFTGNFANALRAAEAATSSNAQLTELRRDPKIQAQYYANYPKRPGYPNPVVYDGVTYRPKKKGGLAAPPGNSRHQLGAAADVKRGPVRDWLQKNGSQFGIGMLPSPLARIDPVHFQQTGGRPSSIRAGLR